MDAHRLDRRIRIETRTVASSDDSPQPAFGEPVPTYTLLAEVWAQMKPLSGREFLSADQMIAEDFIEWTVRWVAGVNALCRIVYKGEHYDIRAVHEIGRREGLRIVTTIANATSE